MIAAISAPSVMVRPGTSSVISRSIVPRVSRSKISAILSSIASRWPERSPTASRWIASGGPGTAERLGEAAALLDGGRGLAERLAQHGVGERLAGDRQRIEERHAVAEQRAQRARKPRGIDLDQQPAEQRQVKGEAVDPGAAL